MAGGCGATQRPFLNSRLQGQLRIVDGVFADDNGPCLPLNCHYGSAFTRWLRDPEWVESQLAAIYSAGYDGIRFWTILSGNYWISKSLDVTEATPDYWRKLESFLNVLKRIGLKCEISTGDVGFINDHAQYADKLAEAVNHVGREVVMLFEGGNEAWQTGMPNPNDLARFVSRFGSQTGWDILLGLTSPPGEEKEGLDKYSINPADVYIVHGYREGHWWDKIRHVFSIPYEVSPNLPLGWQNEPTGPQGKRTEYVSVQSNSHELTSEVMVGHGLMSLIAAQGYTFFCSPGVIDDEPFEGIAGFKELPAARQLLPRDVMFGELQHGGSRWENSRVFEAVNETRCDHRFYDGRKFVCLVYGSNASEVASRQPVRPAKIQSDTFFGPHVRLIVGEIN